MLLFSQKEALFLYFIDNNCGAVAKNKAEIKERLLELSNNHELLKQYADNAWQSGKKNHNKYNIQKMIKNDLVDAIEKI